ncbi:TonB-dependent receptor [Chitinophaga agrisoli]|uniref:TonB-dependent receptor n=2 Tax=Chitinophaga agrisoli TaxID=2607653 RepID=A0A5B2VRU8_9BACT|nr:TonB-dependent receptor [Chitinophaga agrisoli]
MAREGASGENIPPVTITGKVTDSKGQPLAGVNILLKGATTTGTITGSDGAYTLRLPDNNGILIFSFIGYEKQEIAVKNRTEINIILKEAASALTDVVVVGYGSQKKTSLTSSVSQISGADLNKRPLSNFSQALQGQAPGVTVLDQGGIPGRSQAAIRVRGVTTFNVNSSSTSGGYDLSKNDALVIVDGIEQRLMDINPEDIESVSILKDASSTAIYGSRATNGVLLITTKRARSGKLSVSLNNYYALQKSINRPEHMDIESYMRLEQDAYKNAGATVPAKFTDEGIETWVHATDREKYPLPNTWYQTMFRNAPQYSQNLSLSGGNEFFRARANIRYQNQEGVVENFDDKIQEIRLSTDFNPSDRFHFTFDVNYRSNKSQNPTVDPFYNMTTGSLWAVPKYADGTYGLSAQGNNPLMFAEIGGLTHQNENYLLGNVKGEWKIAKGLTFSTQLAKRVRDQYIKSFVDAYTNTDKNTGFVKTVAKNTLNETRNTLEELTVNSLLNYETNIGKHNIKALVGYSQIDNQQTLLNAYRERFYNNEIQSIDQGTNDATKSNSGSDAQFGLRSYFGRLNYAFNDKYLFELNGRYDGSSRFTGDKRYSFFPSLSAGWRISQEPFWQPLADAVPSLKLRGSWGKTGNQSVDLYSYYPSLYLTTYTFGDVPVQGYRQTSLANTDLGWESTTQTDVGMDASFLNNRLSVTVDYYNKQTNDILLNLGIPATIGLAAPPQNAGSVQNKGWEFLVSYRNNPAGNNKLRYSVGANLSINTNKVTDLKGTGPYISGTDIDPRYIIKTGLPINTLWGYKTDGFFQTQQEADAYPGYAPNSKPGDVKYLNLNKDGKIDANDMTAIGNTFPRYIFGVNSDLSYKNFSLNILIQGAADVDTRLSGPITEMGNNEGFTSAIYTNAYWTPERTDARFPRVIKGNLRNVATSDLLVIDASYVRLKNVQLSYSLPQSVLDLLRVARVSVYVSATNLLTISKLNEWNLDPEVPSGRVNYYPQISLRTMGLNIQF